jgi:uncharacterized protein YndB with AHSA1/START domain
MIDGVFVREDGRPALRFERRLPHPVERVWRAVSEPAELERWFPAVVPWTPAAGETFEAAGRHGEITVVEPPRLLAWDFGQERYRFELTAEGEGTRLVFTHVLADPAPAAQHAAGWETYLGRLDAHLAGGHLGEVEAHAHIGELHERYAAAFGADPAPGRAMIASMGFRGLTLEDDGSIRLARRYAHPPERLWRAIADPQERAAWFPPDAPLEVVESDPPRRLVGTWFGDTLTFDIRPAEDGCALVFTHAVSEPGTEARTAAGWDRCFARVDALLAESEMSEAASLADWPAVHERYAAAFGNDPEIGRQAFAAHPRT